MSSTHGLRITLALFCLLVLLAFLTACTAGPSQASLATAVPSHTPPLAPTNTLPPSPTSTAPPSTTPTQLPPTPTETAPPTTQPTPAATPTPHPDSILQFKVGFNPGGAVFSQNGETILLFKDAQFTLVQAADGNPKAEFNIPNRVSSFAMSADGSSFAATSVQEGIGTDILVFAAGSGELVYTISAAHPSSVTNLQFSQDGKTLISASVDHTVKLWNVADGALKLTIPAHQDEVTCMGVSPNNSYIVTGSFFTDKELIAWTLDGQKVSTLMKENTHCYFAAFSPDSRYLLFHNPEKLGLYRVSDWGNEWLVDFNMPSWPFIGFTPDGHIYLGNRQGIVEVRDALTQEITGSMDMGRMAGIGFSPDGRAVVVRSNGIVEILKIVFNQ